MNKVILVYVDQPFDQLKSSFYDSMRCWLLILETNRAVFDMSVN